MPRGTRAEAPTGTKKQSAPGGVPRGGKYTGRGSAAPEMRFAMKLIPGLLIHDTPDGTIAVATGKAASVLNGMIRLSPVAAFLFRELAAGTTEDALIASVLAHYDGVDEPTARQDVGEMLDKLRAAHLLEE